MDGGRVALAIFGTFVAAFVFSMGLRIALAAAFTPSDHLNGPRVVLLWIAPLFPVTVAAAVATRRGWRWVAIALWIYVGLGALSSVACGILAAGAM